MNIENGLLNMTVMGRVGGGSISPQYLDLLLTRIYFVRKIMNVNLHNLTESDQVRKR